MRYFFTVLFLVVLFLPSSALALVPNDTYFIDQWYLSKIDAPQAWDETTGSDKIVVAVLDTGIDIDHPDLARNIWINKDEIPNNNIDDDNNGYIDDVYGWDFEDNDNDPTPVINSGASSEAINHGSAVAGIIGAVGNNGRGLSGVSWDVKIMSVRMLDKIGLGDTISTTLAIDYAVANGADVINLSFAGDTDDPVLRSVIQSAYDAGVVIVSAMGNSSVDTDISPVYPACYGAGYINDSVIGVAATTLDDGLSDFTNYGKLCTDLSAPGVQILGIKYNDVVNGFTDEYGGFWSGTSMSTPIVSGSIALLLSKYPSLTPRDIKTILQLSVDPVNVSADFIGKLGAGRINIKRAFSIAPNFASATVNVIDANTNTITSIAEQKSFVRYVKGTSHNTVYGITSSGERYVFINSQTFFTYENDFSSVETVLDSELSTYPLKGLVLPKAGVVLVKIESDSVVYALEENLNNSLSPVLRKIGDELIAKEMYGNNWADYVLDVSASFFTKFTVGDEITSPESVDTSIMKTRNELTI